MHFDDTLRSVARLSLAAALVLTSGCAPWFDRTPETGRSRTQEPRPSRVEHVLRTGWLPPSVRRFAPILEAASRRHGVDANLLAIVMLVESGGDPSARSPAGAAGLMQIMPDTARDIARWRGIADHHEARLYDPAYNVDLGAWYLARQIGDFWTGDADATVAWAAVAYNGGPGRARRHADTGEPLPTETAQYRHWVSGMWRERMQKGSPTYGAWWHAGGERLVRQAMVPARHGDLELRHA